jgi:hypothetical protein
VEMVAASRHWLRPSDREWGMSVGMAAEDDLVF